MICIYKITNPKNKFYIGKTKDFEKRKKFYFRLGCKDQRKLYYSLKKYGPENHEFEIIEKCLESQLNEREIYWIRELKAVEKGLNLTYGGEGGSMLSEESKKLKRINSMKPIYQFDLEGNFVKKHMGASEAIKDIGKGNSNNINDCARGKYKATYGFQWKYEKDLDLNNLKINSVEYQPRGNFNKWTEKQRQQVKNSRKGEKRSKEYGEKIRKLKLGNKNKLDKGLVPILQYDLQNNFIREFDSVTSAKKFLNLPLNSAGISSCLKNKQKKAYGYVWKYKNNDYKK